MILDDFPRVNEAALRAIDALLSDWLPNGVREGNEFCVGSRHGEAGHSLKVRMTGEKAGYWSDFADDAGGVDLISLYAYLNGIGNGKACYAVAQQLGVELTPDPEWQRRHGDRAMPATSTQKPIKPVPIAPATPAEKPVKRRSPWTPVLPVPETAGPFPKAHTVRGRPDSLWEYRDQEGRLLGVIYRFTTSSGDKEVLPCVYAKNPETGVSEWRWMALPEPRPLYIRGPLRAGVPKVLVEGEKCVDRGHDILGEDFDWLTWPGGCKAVDKADFSLLRDCDVILWPDVDSKTYKEGNAKAGQLKPEAEQPGYAAMAKIYAKLRAQNCSVFFVDVPPPGQLPDGYDVADLVDGGASREEVLAWLTKLRAEESPLSAEADGGVDAPAPPRATASTHRPAAAKGIPMHELRRKLIKTANGGIKGCRENVYMVLESDERLVGLVGLDQFSGLQVKCRLAPWATDAGEWTENDDFLLGMFLAQEHDLVLASIGDIEKGVAQAARQHAFNPVTDYLDACALAWDGTPRVSTCFSRYWGARDSEYMRLVATMFMVGIAKRAYYPGCKHDYAPVFEGGQGEGKSTALGILAGQWFADTPFRMGEKDGFLSIQGVLLYEVAELEQFNRSEVTAIKAFMSSATDRFREPYGRRMKNVPRRCAFAATTNENEYFKDTTGNRRFWPVETGRLDLDGLKRDRDQLFGEAVYLMRAGVKHWPTRDQQVQIINEQQENREIPDVWHGRIYEYLEGIDSDGKPSLAGKRDRVTARELLTKALHFELAKLGQARQETMRIGAIMRKLGWIKGREHGGARERYYERPAVAVAEGIAV